jgi:hypothetical protein
MAAGAAVADEPSRKPPPAPDAPAETPPAADDKPSAQELQELLDSTDEIAKIVSTLRGLPVKKKIARGALSREEITKRLLDKIDQEYKADEIEGEARAWKRLGLLPADTDYKKLVIDLLTEQVAGFYDPDAKELYIADWMEADAQRMVMAHEIDHALQDQAFDLAKFTVPAKDNGDLQLARQALVEGDGMALMIEFMFHERSMKVDPWADDKMVDLIAASVAMTAGMDQLGSAPMFIREQLLFPYARGLRFIARARRVGAWNEIDSMYKSPPVSTEQILHPEKYKAGEKPLAVRAANLPALKGWKKQYENVLGEMMWAILLREHGVSESRAETAAAGWGGDRLVVYAPTADGALDDLVAISLSTWDAEMDALEAFAAADEALATLAGAAAPSEKTATFRSYTDASGDVSFLERKDASLLLVVGAPADLAAKLRKQTWARWKKR